MTVDTSNVNNVAALKYWNVTICDSTFNINLLVDFQTLNTEVRDECVTTFSFKISQHQLSISSGSLLCYNAIWTVRVSLSF